MEDEYQVLLIRDLRVSKKLAEEASYLTRCKIRANSQCLTITKGGQMHMQVPPKGWDG